MRKLFLQAFLFVAAVGCGNADGPAGQPMVPAEPGICTLIGCTSGATYSGSISLNGAQLDPSAPFGGYKKSGNGREWSDYAFDEFLEVKSLLGFGA